MKWLQAFVLTLLLALGQSVTGGVGSVPSVESLPAPCQCCSCGGTGCCVDERSSAPSAPALPVPVRGQADDLMGPATRPHRLLHSHLAPGNLSGAPIFPRLDSWPAVPLHARNCTFLI
ncbi:MAG: hypothetical protein ACYDC1_00390 [Limisphaerales bacterium]